jgi:hypothetical protein
MNHTPGPWVVRQSEIDSAFFEVVAYPFNSRRQPVWVSRSVLDRADAALISAAPEMKDLILDLVRLAQSRFTGEPAITRALDLLERLEGRAE